MNNPYELNTPKKEQNLRCRILTQGAYSSDYEFDESFRAWDGKDPRGVHTTAELLQCLESNPQIELDARVLGLHQNKWLLQNLNRHSFTESFKKDSWKNTKFKETDFFAQGGNFGFGDTVGQDFTPLLGGPFYKNLYYYQDYIRMHSEAFFAYHHDPVARAITQITRDFVLGTGFEVQCDTSQRVGQMAMAAWRAFEVANNYSEQIDQCVNELSIYGENMWWWLPNNQTKIVYSLPANQIPTGVIPRIRLIDPSNLVEIVTYPEDITRVLFYVWLTPTQYQIYTSGINSGADQKQDLGVPNQPTLKFIYQQIPADQVNHVKINAVSNEKRGRSDYFPVLGYLKRLRDSISYALIAQQKTSSWAIDTTIDGDQSDVDAYTRAMAALTTIPPAGSEFAHTKQIKREIIANNAAGRFPEAGSSWALSMIAAGTGIPVSYLGTHLSGGTTKASALVATEPVAKKMENRREVIKRMIRGHFHRLMKECGLPMVDCDVIIPEIITQDRTQKLKDILLMQQARWLSPQNAANLAAKEMQIQKYDYQQELKDMDEQLPEVPMPLVAPGKISSTGQMQTPTGATEQPGADVAAVTGQDRVEAKADDRSY